MVVLTLLLPDGIRPADSGKADRRTHLAELARLGARKAFLTDSSDVYLEPHSLNRFFTIAIYRKMQGTPISATTTMRDSTSKERRFKSRSSET